MKSAKKLRKRLTVSISAAEVTKVIRKMKLALSFRDIEDSARSFSGKDNLSLEVWVNEFKDMSTIMLWNDSKRSLHGFVKMFSNS